jgi:hypothetical protein
VDGYVARRGDRRGAYRFLLGRPREMDHLKDLSIDGRMTLKWILKRWNGRYGLDLSGSGYG